MVLQIEPVREIDVRLAIQQIAQIHAGPLQMNGVDLEIAPVECAIRIVMINLTLALWIFDALDGQRNPAIGPKLAARVLLIRGERSLLIGLSMMNNFGLRAAAHHHRRLKVNAHGRLNRQAVTSVYENRRAN